MKTIHVTCVFEIKADENVSEKVISDMIERIIDAEVYLTPQDKFYIVETDTTYD
jgi:hypothetical protein